MNGRRCFRFNLTHMRHVTRDTYGSHIQCDVSVACCAFASITGLCTVPAQSSRTASLEDVCDMRLSSVAFTHQRNEPSCVLGLLL